MEMKFNGAHKVAAFIANNILVARKNYLKSIYLLEKSGYHYH
jgi:hypothetical protein